MNKLVVPTKLKKKQRLFWEDENKQWLVIDRWPVRRTNEEVILLDKTPSVKYKYNGEIRTFRSNSRLLDEGKFIRLIQSINHSSRGDVVAHIEPGHFTTGIQSLSEYQWYSWLGRKVSSGEYKQIKRIQIEAKFISNTLKIKDLDTLSLLVKLTCRGVAEITFFFSHCTVLGSIDDMIFALYDVDSRYKDEIHKKVRLAGLYIR